VAASSNGNGKKVREVQQRVVMCFPGRSHKCDRCGAVITAFCMLKRCYVLIVQPAACLGAASIHARSCVVLQHEVEADTCLAGGQASTRARSHSGKQLIRFQLHATEPRHVCSITSCTSCCCCCICVSL
jgi:hypothetical protein